MRSAIYESFGIPETTPIDELRHLLRGRCHRLDQYTLDVHGLRSFIRHISDRKPSADQWFRRILLFLGRKPAEKWKDQDRDTAEYRLSEFAADYSISKSSVYMTTRSQGAMLASTRSSC